MVQVNKTVYGPGATRYSKTLLAKEGCEYEPEQIEDARSAAPGKQPEVETFTVSVDDNDVSHTNNVHPVDIGGSGQLDDGSDEAIARAEAEAQAKADKKAADKAAKKAAKEAAKANANKPQS